MMQYEEKLETILILPPLCIVTMKSYDEGYLFLLSNIYIHEFKVDIQSAISSFSFSPLFLRVEHKLSSPSLFLCLAVLLSLSLPLHLLFSLCPFVVTFLITPNVVGELRE